MYTNARIIHTYGFIPRNAARVLNKTMKTQISALKLLNFSIKVQILLPSFLSNSSIEHFFRA